VFTRAPRARSRATAATPRSCPMRSARFRVGRNVHPDPYNRTRLYTVRLTSPFSLVALDDTDRNHLIGIIDAFITKVRAGDAG
jgi:hypothetical protein